MRSTDSAYTERLVALEGKRWKRFLPNPYCWHIRARCPGRVLDVGCGIGRCLAFLGDRGVGVDPNQTAVVRARLRGTEAYTSADLLARSSITAFDTLLCSHVLEHLAPAESVELLRTWLPRVRPGGRVVLICPQRRGFASDPTHVRYMGSGELRQLCDTVGVHVERVRSFPLPRLFGRWWVHNETVLVGRAP